MKLTTRHATRLLAGMVAVLTVACTGDVGPTGPPGADGADGAAGADGSPGADGASATQTVTGSVDDPGSSPAPAGVPVRALLLDLDGKEAALLGAGLTDATGSYSLEVPANLTLGPQILVSAAVPNRTVTALVLAATQDIDAVTDGVARAVRAIVSAPGGTAMTAFDATEVGQLVTDAGAALTTAGTDLADESGVLAEIFDALGTDVSAASGVVAQAAPSTVLVTSDPPGTDVAAAFTVDLTDGGSELWDITSEGAVDDGTNDSYDTFFQLSISGNPFPAGTGVIRDDRTVVISQTDVGGTGVDVTRKAYVSDTDAFARFAEVLSNPGGTDVTVDVRIFGNLGSDESIDLVHFSSSGDAVVDPDDQWLASHWDLSDPALAWIFAGASPSKSGDDIEWTWSDVTVPAGGTVVLFHFGFQLTGGPVPELAETVAAIGVAPPAEFYAGATIADAEAGLNGGRSASVFGDGGAAVPGEVLTITNTTTTDVDVVTAAGDGSFRSLLVAASGHAITIQGDKGTTANLTVS